MKKSGDMKRKKQFNPTKLTCCFGHANRNLNPGPLPGHAAFIG